MKITLDYAGEGVHSFDLHYRLPMKGESEASNEETRVPEPLTVLSCVTMSCIITYTASSV